MHSIFPRSAVRLVMLALYVFSLVTALPNNRTSAQTSPDVQTAQQIKESMFTGEMPVPARVTPPSALEIDIRNYVPESEIWTDTVFQGYKPITVENETPRLGIFRVIGRDNIRLPIASGPGNDTRPRLNRGATQVVFVSTRDGNPEIYRANVDGSGLARLTNSSADDNFPAWSPDNQRVVFASQRGGNWEIYSMNANGSDQRRLSNAGGDNVMPAWSPDGRSIVWVRRVQLSQTTSERKLWIMDADGRNARALTEALPYAQSPAWSPDGSQIAFDMDLDGDTWNEIAAVNTDGTGLRKIYDDSQGSIDHLVGSWLPNGEQLVISTMLYQPYNGEFYLQDFSMTIVSLNGTTSMFHSSRMGFLPDARSRDQGPPTTSVASLPRYTRAGRLHVTWSGLDEESGIANYDVEYRVNDGNWTTLLKGTVNTEADVPAPAGSTVSFRSRATDKSGQTEAWPQGSDGDTNTTLYTSFIDGTITDTRGIPQIGRPFSITPAPLASPLANWLGRYRALLVNNGNYTVTAQVPGHGEILPTQVSITDDRSLMLVAPPKDNVISNGTFEANDTQLQGWIGTGSPTPRITTDLAATGLRAAALGDTCIAPCLTKEEILGAGQVTSVAVDSGGTLHTTWFTQDANYSMNIYYRTRSADGIWSSPELVGAGAWGQLAIDKNDTVHMLWPTAINGYSLTYRQRVAGGAWSAPETLQNGISPRFVVSDDGRVHVLYGCHYTICSDGRQFYITRHPSGGWSTPLPLNVTTDLGGMSDELAVAPDGTVHIAWLERGIRNGQGYSAIAYQNRSLDGQWSQVEYTYSGDAYELSLAADGFGNVYLYIRAQGLDTFLQRRTPEGEWLAPRKVTSNNSSGALAADTDGNVYLITSTMLNGNYANVLYQKSPTSDWKSLGAISNTPVLSPVIATDRYGRIAIAWADAATDSPNSRVRVTQSSAAAQSAISTTVTIPQGLHQPTLSWLYALERFNPKGGNMLQVTATDGIETRDLTTASASTGWQHAWANLSSWAGKTVTVTFTLEQAEQAAPAKLWIDDVSLGSWQTPVITSISAPSTIGPEATELTIRGNNFLALPTVQLGTIELMNVQLIDEQTLKATVPANTAPGAYRLFVTNPGGQRISGPIVLVGHMLHLPLTLR